VTVEYILRPIRDGLLSQRHHQSSQFALRHLLAALSGGGAAEGRWDVGSTSACMPAAAALWAGAPISLGILPSLLEVLAIFMLLRRYYGEIRLKGLPPPWANWQLIGIKALGVVSERGSPLCYTVYIRLGGQAAVGNPIALRP
jgi:hypothetical protein